MVYCTVDYGMKKIKIVADVKSHKHKCKPNSLDHYAYSEEIDENI